MAEITPQQLAEEIYIRRLDQPGGRDRIAPDVLARDAKIYLREARALLGDKRDPIVAAGLAALKQLRGAPAPPQAEDAPDLDDLLS